MIFEDSLTPLFSCLSIDSSDMQKQAIVHLGPEQWQELFTVAHYHCVAPLLYYRLQQSDLFTLMPTVLQEELKKTHQRNAVRNLQILHEVGQILQCLQPQTEVILLKGVDLAATVYPYNALRYMADIDLLVRKQDLSTVEQLLKERHYVNSMINTALPSSSDQHLAPFMRPDMPAGIEVHYTITPPQYATFDLAQLWHDARHITVAGQDTLGLSVTDLVLHICVHTTYQHRLRNTVRALCDIDAIIRHYQAEIQWERCIQDAYQRNWHKGLFLCLYLAKDWLATPVPAFVLAMLRPADFNEHIFTQVRQQILLHNKAPVRSRSLLQMLNQKGICGKLGILRQRIFLPKAKLLQMYPTAAKSLGYYFYYFVRLKHLFQQHSDTVWQLLFGGSRTKAIVKQQKDLLTWLSE